MSYKNIYLQAKAKASSKEGTHSGDSIDLPSRLSRKKRKDKGY